MNVAVTDRACVIDTVQVPVALVHAPVQPAKVEPDAAAAVSVTELPLLTLTLHTVPQYRKEGQVVSSTAIRTLLAAGAVRGAADLLGRPYRVAGELLPTGEFCVDELRILPRPAPYEAQLSRDAEVVDAVATVLPVEARLTIEFTANPLPPGRANLDFVRRGD